MAKLSINNLDFLSNRSALRDYLKTQEQFKDYDFDGSNLSVLLDVLAYNTYQNNFYGNMLFSEMFLDSAQTYGATISHAKELNYLPRSTRSAKAVVTLILSSTTLQEQVIPKGTRFTAGYEGTTYSFYTRKTYTATRVVGTNRLEAKCIEIFEGTPIEEIFFKPTGQIGVELSNELVDTDTIEVESETDLPDVYDSYIYKSDIFGVAATDRVFYLELNFTEKYKVVFGANRFGYDPSSQSRIKIRYSVASGASANGASVFTCSSFPISSVITISKAAGGADRETIEEIKFNAPKSIQTQDRAVTVLDYKTLLTQRYPQIDAISVFSGDELDPPQFGKVAIIINLKGNSKASTSFKNDIVTYLSPRTPVGIKPIFIDPQFLYGQVSASVYFDQTRSTKSNDQVAALVKDAILSFSDTKLSDFGSKLMISQILQSVNSVAPEISGASIDVKPIIDYSPAFGIFQTSEFDFGMELLKPYPFDQSKDIETYKPAVKSTEFVYDGSICFLQDDGNGNIMILSANALTTNVLEPKIGTVDYETGKVRLVNFAVDSYVGQAIKLVATTVEKNIFSPKQRIFLLRNEDITLSVNRIS